MIYLYGLEKINNDKYKVNNIHYRPFDPQYGLGKTQEELEQDGILIESLTEPEDSPFKSAVLYCNPQTKEVWYEYEDRPLTEQERIEQLEQAILELTMLLGN